MTDSIAKSAGIGRVAGMIIMTLLGSYLASKGVELSETDKEAGATMIESSAAAFAAIIPLVISKWRSVKRAKKDGE